MLVYLQNLILEMVARGEELRATTDRLCREVERLAPGTICSILSVDADGVLHPVAGPSLPQAYNDAIDGLKMGAVCWLVRHRRLPSPPGDRHRHRK